MVRYVNAFVNYDKKGKIISLEYLVFQKREEPVDKSFRGSNQQVSFVKGDDRD
jgi:hypothetical protein